MIELHKCLIVSINERENLNAQNTNGILNHFIQLTFLGVGVGVGAGLSLDCFVLQTDTHTQKVQH